MTICPFRKYRNLLGRPGKGVHKYTFLNTAIVDYTLALLLAALVAYIAQIPLVLTTIGVLLGAMLLHVLFGVQTHTLDYLGISCS